MQALKHIKNDLGLRLEELETEGKLLEALRRSSAAPSIWR